MKHYFRDWYASETGFYRPMHLVRDAFLLVCCVLLLFAAAYRMGEFPFISLIILTLPAFRLVGDYCQYGPQGKPLVTVKNDILFFARTAHMSGENIELKVTDLD
jgi:hypothetical protein